MFKSSEEIAAPKARGLKSNQDKPTPSVERQEAGRVNSPNQAGGYVPPQRLNNA